MSAVRQDSDCRIMAKAALTAIVDTCRGSGPMARDHDADTLRCVGLYAEAILKTLPESKQ